MDRSVHRPTMPPHSITLGRTLELALQLAIDEFRLWRLELHDRPSDVMRRSVWIGFGVLCLAIAWVMALAVVVVALEDRFSLEARLAMLAISQLALGAALVWLGLRGRRAAR